MEDGGIGGGGACSNASNRGNFFGLYWIISEIDMGCTQAELAVVVMMPEPLLAPFPEELIEEEMVSFHNFEICQKLTCLHSCKCPLLRRGHVIDVSTMVWSVNGLGQRTGKNLAL